MKSNKVDQNHYYLTNVIESMMDGLLSAAEGGFIMIPSPMRIDTTPAISGRVPGASWWRLTFVPEPGTMLLLVAGAVGLAVVGRRRARK